MMTSLSPPRVPSEYERYSTFQPRRSAYRVYMRWRSAANSAASSPPVPRGSPRSPDGRRRDRGRTSAGDCRLRRLRLAAGSPAQARAAPWRRAWSRDRVTGAPPRPHVRARRRDGRGGSVFLPAVLLPEPLNASRSVDQLLLPGVERVAVRADVRMDLRLGRARLECIAARADDRRGCVFWMNVGFHSLLTYFVRWKTDRPFP